MNKKEVLEIRKQFSPENCAITRICGCYVDHEKEKKMELKKAFLSLPEEEAFKYFDIFKHTLSGTIGKNLINMEFPLDQELNGGTQEFLMKLKDSKLQDDMLLEEFYDKIVESYEYGENYYIILIHAVYDVPGKTKDGLEMEDASDTVYEHLLCSICPVNLTKAGLTYNAATNNIEDRIRDWIVEAPVKGFLFPAFQDRATDVHNVLYYTKKPEELQPYFVEHVLGSTTPLTAGDQKTTFQTIVSDALGEDSSYEVVRNIHDNLNEMIEQAKEEGIFVHPAQTFERILKTENGAVAGVGFSDIASFTFDENRCAIIEKVEGSYHEIQADTVIFAVGQRCGLAPEAGLARGRANSIAADSKTLATDVEGIFACGDVTYGTKSVVLAVADGRKAAESIDKYLGGNGDISEVLAPVEEHDPLIGKAEGFGYEKRRQPQILSTEERKDNFKMVDHGICDEEICGEASRCLQCDLRMDITKSKIWSEYGKEADACC